MHEGQRMYWNPKGLSGESRPASPSWSSSSKHWWLWMPTDEPNIWRLHDRRLDDTQEGEDGKQEPDGGLHAD